MLLGGSLESEGGTSLPRIYLTIIRQSIASMARDEQKPTDEFESLANHMSHNANTVNRYKDGTQGQHHSEVACDMLHQLYG